jgi:hypothetical protein
MHEIQIKNEKASVSFFFYLFSPLEGETIPKEIFPLGANATAALMSKAAVSSFIVIVRDDMNAVRNG